MTIFGMLKQNHVGYW